MPKYVHGKGARQPGNASRTAATSSSEHRIGEMEHFSMFVMRPEESAKRSRMALMHRRSSLVGERKTTKSSAYREARLRIIGDGSGWRTPRASAAEIMQFKTSMAMTKSMGDSGSPCLRPRACHIFLPGLPFMSTLVDALDSKIVIHSVQRAGKPQWCSR
jgi:hypothetical protein